MQKTIRQSAIAKAITDGNIHNQNELQEILKVSKINVTQSTLSRDLKEMKIMRLPNADGEYVYALPLEASMVSYSGRNYSEMKDSSSLQGSHEHSGTSARGTFKYVNENMPADAGHWRNAKLEESDRQKIKVRSIEFSSLFAVIKTAPGFASAVAAVIDDNNINGIMGTIAGDDTILVMIKDGFTQPQIVSNLSTYISGLS